MVQFGQENLKNEATNIPKKFVDGGSEHRPMWIHYVHLKGLLPDTRYCKLNKIYSKKYISNSHCIRMA